LRRKNKQEGKKIRKKKRPSGEDSGVNKKRRTERTRRGKKGFEPTGALGGLEDRRQQETFCPEGRKKNGS